MRTLLFLTAAIIIVTSCGPNSSPEKRMNIKNHELEEKVEVLVKQQKSIRDSITILNTKIDGIKKK
jgi:hypothetical protein